MSRYRKQRASPGAALPEVVRVLNATQDAIDETTKPLVEHPLLGSGRIIEDVSLSATPTDVPHLLQRRPAGWFIVRRDADARVWEGTQTDAAMFLTLVASAAVTVNVYVFA